MQGKGLLLHSFSLLLFGECYFYSIPFFYVTTSIKQINPAIKAKMESSPIQEESLPCQK